MDDFSLKPRKTPDVAAIMVNWNGGTLAVESARSIEKQSIQPALYVVDNASQDGSADAIAIACPSARILRNQRNIGFAAGNNLTWEKAVEADYLLLVNNDVLLPDVDALKSAVDYLAAHPASSGVCGRYEYPGGEFQHFYNQLPTLFDMVVTWGAGKYWPPFLHSDRTRKYHLEKYDFAAASTIEQPAFACVLLRASCARRVGMFDEQFPIFFNDIDYCWRWREQGFDWHYLPSWRIVHHKSSTTGKMGAHLRAELAGSAVRFALKHFNTPKSYIIRIAVLLEALWRKYRHSEYSMPIKAIWLGQTSFLEFESKHSTRRAHPLS